MLKVKSLGEFMDTQDKVGILSGRFSPVTQAHADIIKQISEENERGIVFLVKGKATSKDKDVNPFDADVQLKLIEAVLPSNMTVQIIPTGFFPDEINKMDEKEFTIYAGSDRIETYAKWASYMEDDRVLHAKEIERTNEDISATKVRTALREDDKLTFEAMTPNEIHGFYEELHSLVEVE